METMTVEMGLMKNFTCAWTFLAIRHSASAVKTPAASTVTSYAITSMIVEMEAMRRKRIAEPRHVHRALLKNISVPMDTA